MDKVCPSCGAESSRKKFAGDFCFTCYSSRILLETPRVVSILQCRFCGRIKDGKEWVPDNQKNVEKMVLSETKGKYSNALVDLGQTPKITFVFEIGDSFVEIVRNFELKRGGSMCANCSRKTSGYFEAIIQLRGEFDKIAKAQDRIGKKLEKTTVISKVEELKEGVDLYVGSKKATALALSDLGFHFTTSNKLFGVRDGQRIYRTTFCVRVWDDWMKRKLGKEEGELVSKKITEMRAQIASGKKKTFSIEEIAKEAGVDIWLWIIYIVEDNRKKVYFIGDHKEYERWYKRCGD